MVREVPPKGGEGGMGGSILGASEDRSNLQLTAAEASVVQQESFPPYFGRGEQSMREGGRSNTGHHAQFPGEMVVVRGQEGMNPLHPSPSRMPSWCLSVVHIHGVMVRSPCLSVDRVLGFLRGAIPK